MSGNLKLYLLILAIPALALAVSYSTQSLLSSQWRKALTEEYNVETARAPENQLARVCTYPEARELLPDLCRDMALLRLVRLGAIGVVAAGGLFLLLLRALGLIAARSRTLLLVLFRPTAYLTAIFVIVLVVFQAALGIGAAWSLSTGMAYQHPVILLTILGIGFIALIGVALMSVAALSMLMRPVAHEPARLLTRERHPAIWSFTEAIASQLGTEPPNQIAAGLHPNFFVTEIDVETLDGRHSGRTLFLSLPLLRILSREELAAIIGHELGHFRGQDTAFSRRFYPAYRGIQGALAAALWNPTEGALALTMPAAYTLQFFLNAFETAEAGISREREFLADRAGAEAAGVQAMGSALIKLHAFSGIWEGVVQEMTDHLSREEMLPNAGERYLSLVREQTSADVLQGIDAEHLPHPVDSHPPLRQRLEALGVTKAALAEQALQTAPDRPAIDLLGDVAELEEELTSVEHEIIQSQASSEPPAEPA